jgi:hypothetical protein
MKHSQKDRESMVPALVASGIPSRDVARMVGIDTRVVERMSARAQTIQRFRLPDGVGNEREALRLLECDLLGLAFKPVGYVAWPDSTVRYGDEARRPRITGRERRQVFERDRYRCVYCGVRLTFSEFDGGRDPDHATVDHVIAHENGGESTIDNSVACCRRCNSVKRNEKMLERSCDTTHFSTQIQSA